MVMQSISPNAAPLKEGPALQTPIRVAYITSMRELESEGVGGLIQLDYDTLSTLLSYRRDGQAPQPGDPVSHHWDHRANQTYQVVVVITDDDLLNPLTATDPTPNTRRRILASGLPHEEIPSSGWCSIKSNPSAKAEAKAAYEQRILDVATKYGVDVIISDSYTRLFGSTALNEMGHRILNIHPAYTPDLPGITPTIDGAFRHGLFRRINSSENFITRHGERFYHIPLRYEHLFSAHDAAGVLRGFHNRRIVFGPQSRERVAAANGHDLVVTDNKGRHYLIARRNGQINVLEHEVSRANELFVNRFARTSIEVDGRGQYWLVTPVNGERGRFSARTGATFHEIDSGIDTGRILHFARSTPIRNMDTSATARMAGRPRSPSIDEGSERHRDGIQTLRERNYATKNNVLKIGILQHLHSTQMRERVVQARESSPTQRLQAN